MRGFVVAIAMVALLAGGCGSVESGTRTEASGAECSAPELMIQYGCPTCHVVPHVPGAVGKVGPSLDALAQRSYIAGSLQNTPQNLRQWIMHPQHYQPGTAMPEMGVTPQDADRIAAFLESHP